MSLAGMVTTLAGSDSEGFADGIGTLASFNHPSGVAVDAQGNLYVADLSNSTIRKMSPAGEVTTLAGSGAHGSADGMGISASFHGPNDVAVDVQGNIYVADTYNHSIRKISPVGMVTTLAGNGSEGSADGIGTSASFNEPSALAVDGQGYVYVADKNSCKIRKISPAGQVTTLAGNGTWNSIDGIGTSASFCFPNSIAVDVLGNVYVADDRKSKIRKISPSGVVTTLTGNRSVRFSRSRNGKGSSTSFTNLRSIIVDTQGNLYVLDCNKMKKISPTGNIDTLEVGSFWKGSADGIGSTASFNDPGGIAVDSQGTVYVADRSNGKIRKISPSGMVSTLAGGGSKKGFFYYFFGPKNGKGNSASFNEPNGITVDIKGNVYVTDDSSNNIRKISPSGRVTTLAGKKGWSHYGSTDGTGSSASFFEPSGIAVDAQGNIYVADSGNHKIRKIDPSGMVTTFAGNDFAGSTDGIGTSASFRWPNGIAIDAQGNIYVAGDDKIRKIDPSGMVTTFAGNGFAGSTDGIGISASFNEPNGIAIDTQGAIYVADRYNRNIRKISPAGVVTTLAGSGSLGSANGIGILASFCAPDGIAVDGQGNVYVTDDNKIRKIETKGYTISPELPTGLSLDPATGTISGTPTVASPKIIYTVTATNNSGSSTAKVSITVN